jgi:RHS repeat-associated protein
MENIVSVIASSNATNIEAYAHENVVVGDKAFELSDHRGDVNVVVTDRKLGVDSDNNGVVDYYTADVVGYADYYPFGMLMPNRHGGTLGRYGFNGMESIDEVSGAKNSYDFGARLYNPRIGRWFRRDAASSHYVSLSPYVFVANSVLVFIDPSGNLIEIAPGLSEEKQKAAEAVLTKMSEEKPNLYTYFNQLKYHGESKKFVSPGDEGYDEAFDVKIYITIEDIDDKPGHEEKMNAHNTGRQSMSMIDSPTSHLEGLVARTENWEQGKISNDNNIVIRHNDGSIEKIEVTSPEHARKIDEALNTGVVKQTNITNRITIKDLTNATNESHVVIKLDDFISGGIKFKAEVLSHELGHIEGWINNPIEAILYGGECKGHCEGYSGGENAVKREKNDK